MLENYRRCRFCIFCVSEGCGLDLGSWVGCGGCGLGLDHLWTLVFTETTSERVSAEERGVTQGASSAANLLLLFFPQLKHTHTHTESWPPTHATTAHWHENDSAFTLSSINLSSTRGIRYVKAWLYICVIMWSRDGKSISPPGTLMCLC